VDIGKPNLQIFDGFLLLVCDYLVIQATSIPSEQIFSVAKINPERNRLDSEKARATLCLKT
ncbi:7359_t:CDS:1, partial [Ambispora leptoticha]